VTSPIPRLVLWVMILLATGSTTACAPRSTDVAPGRADAVIEDARPPELVVLVHGLGRTPLSMLPLAWALEREGYRVLNWGYSSTCCSIAEIGEQLRTDLQAYTASEAPSRVHFVGHSLGNVIVRWLLAHERPERMGRVVMLAPPNQGSHEADRFAPWLGWLLEPLPELRTDPTSTVRSLPAMPPVSVGVIAGEHDGKVSLAETHLEGEAAHVVVPAAHSFIMLRGNVQRLTLEFLRDGDFDLED
jgi:pimeloyl-ACP methyl ester carboxylesterase